MSSLVIAVAVAMSLVATQCLAAPNQPSAQPMSSPFSAVLSGFQGREYPSVTRSPAKWGLEEPCKSVGFEQCPFAADFSGSRTLVFGGRPLVPASVPVTSAPRTSAPGNHSSLQSEVEAPPPNQERHLHDLVEVASKSPPSVSSRQSWVTVAIPLLSIPQDLGTFGVVTPGGSAGSSSFAGEGSSNGGTPNPPNSQIVPIAMRSGNFSAILNFTADLIDESYWIDNSATSFNSTDSIYVAGPSAFVTSPSGDVYFASMCAVMQLPFKLTTNVVMRLDPTTLVFSAVWTGDIGDVIVNATCVSAQIPRAQVAGWADMSRSVPSEEVLVIFGGVRMNNGTMAQLSGTAVDSLSLTRFRKLHHRAMLPSSISAQVMWPCVVPTSSSFFLVGGGEFALPGNPVRIVSIPLFDVTLFADGSIVYGEIATLPEFFRLLAPSPFNTALSLVNTQIVFITMDPAVGGRVATFDLYTATHGGTVDWVETPLKGGVFGMTGSTVTLLSLPQPGSQTSSGSDFLRSSAGAWWLRPTICSFGGANFSAPAGGPTASIPFAVECDVLEFLAALPVAVSVVSTEYHPIVPVAAGEVAVNMTVVNLKLLSAIPAGGTLALSPDPSCRNRPSSHGTTTQFQLNFTATPQLFRQMIYVCFHGSLDSVTWRTTTGSRPFSDLYFVINSIQPFMVDMPYAPPPPPAEDRVSWSFYAVIAFLVVICLAFVIIVAAFARHFWKKKRNAKRKHRYERLHKGNRNDSKGSWSERSFLPDIDESAEAFFNRLHISTNSHSSRYEMMKSLSSPDGVMPRTEDVRSSHTFLVRRKQDKALLAMKYYRCDNDLHRIIAMQQFELMQMLQGHPNVLGLVDMFMSYTFGESGNDRKAIRPKISGPSAQPSDPLLTADSGYGSAGRPLSRLTGVPGAIPNGSTAAFSLAKSPNNSQKTFYSSANNDSFDHMDSSISGFSGFRPPSSRGHQEQRYLCIVTEFHPLGNLENWCRSHAAGVRHVDEDMSSAIPEVCIVSVGEQLLSLVYFMHTEFQPPLLHRGLKPENVLVTCAPSFRPGAVYLPIVVSDFGCFELGNYAPPAPVTTPASASSRQIAEDRRSDFIGDLPFPSGGDVWCVGCILLSMCLLRFGDDFPRLGQILVNARKRTYEDRILDDVERDIRSRGYSADLAQFIRMCLCREDRHRPSAGQLLQHFVRVGDNKVALHFPDQYDDEGRVSGFRTMSETTGTQSRNFQDYGA